MVSSARKTVKYLQGDRFRGPLGEGTLTLVRKKGLFPYEITWWNGQTGLYSAEQIERYGYQHLPPDPDVEDIEEEETTLFDGDFSREQDETAIAPTLTWKDWKKGDRVRSEVTKKRGVIEKLKFRPQCVFIVWDNSPQSIEHSPDDLKLLDIELDSGKDDFPRERDWQVGDRISVKGFNGEIVSFNPLNFSFCRYEIAWDGGGRTLVGKEDLEPCLDNLTSAQVLVSDSPLQDSKSEGLPLLDFAKLTTTAEISSPSDSQACQSLETSSVTTGEPLEESTSLQLVPLVNPSQSKESDSQLMTSETVSQPSSKRSPKSSRRISASKTSKACFHAHIDLEANSDTLEVSCPTFPSAGTMSSGSWLVQECLERPFLESGCSWLESPNGLSAVGRVPGQSRLEAQLKSEQHLEDGQTINPAFLEDAFEIPLGWCDRLVSRPAIQLLEESEKRSVTVSTPESQPLHSAEFSTLTESLKSEEDLTPVDESAVGRHYWCDRLDVTVTIETVHNWRVTPRAKELTKAARCRPWWGNFPDVMVIQLDELVEIEKLSCLIEENPVRALDAQVRSLEKSLIPEIPIPGISPNPQPQTNSDDSLEKPETQTTKQVGSLYQYTANKADKAGHIATYPKVEGDRSREEDSHWYWGFSYVEKQNGKWRDKSAAVPRKKLPEVREALRAGKNYTYILQQVLGKD